MFDSVFHLAENRTNVRTEVLAGFTTFLTMAYILFVQPAVLARPIFQADLREWTRKRFSSRPASLQP